MFKDSMGTATTGQIAETLQHDQYTGLPPLVPQYEEPEELLQQREAKQRAADAAMNKLLGGQLLLPLPAPPLPHFSCTSTIVMHACMDALLGNSQLLRLTPLESVPSLPAARVVANFA